MSARISALEQQPCDAISREAVNTLVDELARAISDERCCIPQRGRSTENIMHDILDLPSVTPAKCEDAISRATAKTRIYLKYVNRPDICKAMFKILDGVPSVQPSRKGHWIRKVDFGNCLHYVCSECENEGENSDYCPYCGAEMESEE